MRKEFIVERQGKSFCLYAGLLDLAHQQGLKSLTTDLVQIPSEANNRVAICTATVVMEHDGNQRVFQGIGDAAVNNVAPAMAVCLIRMAETRAKARALRDAVNIGVSAFEELGEDDAHDGAPERGYAPPRRSTRQPTPAAQPAPARTAPNPGDPATPAQREAITKICDNQKRDADKFVQTEIGTSLENITQGQAADIIRKLNTPPARTTA